MARRHRVRRVAKWTGVIVCMTVVAVWAISVPGYFLRTDKRPGSRLWLVGLTRGAVFVVFHPSEDFPPGVWTELGPEVTWGAWMGIASHLPMAWRPSVGRDPNWSGATKVRVPLWMPFAGVLVPTAWLWWRDRRPSPGHCPCGYDLAGLTPGAACPECGRAQKAEA